MRWAATLLSASVPLLTHAAGTDATGTISWTNDSRFPYRVTVAGTSGCVQDPGHKNFTMGAGTTYTYKIQLDTPCRGDYLTITWKVALKFKSFPFRSATLSYIETDIDATGALARVAWTIPDGLLPLNFVVHCGDTTENCIGRTIAVKHTNVRISASRSVEFIEYLLRLRPQSR
jgi:hypothetical protein